eukprot:scaffold1341_cov178-Amphora_coffeaeformis.AAC.11
MAMMAGLTLCSAMHTYDAICTLPGRGYHSGLHTMGWVGLAWLDQMRQQIYGSRKASSHIRTSAFRFGFPFVKR